MRISDWSSDVRSSDLSFADRFGLLPQANNLFPALLRKCRKIPGCSDHDQSGHIHQFTGRGRDRSTKRSEEHTSELQSLMRISYAVLCLKTKQTKQQPDYTATQ